MFESFCILELYRYAAPAPGTRLSTKILEVPIEQFTANTIGYVKTKNDCQQIEVLPAYREGLTALEGFGHIQVLWWAHLCAAEERDVLQLPQPYRGAPQTMGVFATRSPARPNPIGLSVCGVLQVLPKEGIVLVGWLDTEDGTPVLDIKPYAPSVDRVQNPQVPVWCAHWPTCIEDSGDFDWEAEFLF